VGVGARYGLRAQGPFDPTAGWRFNPAKLLVDPFATRLDRPFKLDPRLFDARVHGEAADDADNASLVPKAIVEAAGPLPQPRRPVVAWRDLIIYEMHVRGFTQTFSEIPEAARGTFAGLAHPASIAHLTRLGVTAVELLPIAAWVDERHLPQLGLADYWGYNPIALLAPDPRLAPGGWTEVRHAVETLHAAGIAVILDIVLNHTGESDALGPTLSLRGLDNAGFYRLQRDDPATYENQSGCGNVLALERPQGLRLALEALRTSAIRAGVDGFRYDLASVLARGERGFDPAHPFLAAIAQDPTLRDLIHIAEPWDLGHDGYRLGAFPPNWGEWNDRARDAFRGFWRGHDGLIGTLATRLAGSADIFAARYRPLSRSINFVTAHDGFTLADLVAYAARRNEANGEDNRDGTADNLSWNCGIEGETLDAAVLAMRKGDVRALLTTLIAARGTPMLSMGDELGRSQRGNNNCYAQDNELSWINWESADAELIDFSARLIRLRRSIGAFTGEFPLTGVALDASGIPDVQWLNPEGAPLTDEDWNDAAAQTLIAVFYDPGDGKIAPSRASVLLNRGFDAVAIRLPEPRENQAWKLELDSAAPQSTKWLDGDRLMLAARSAAIVAERVAPSARRRAGIDDRALDALFSAAGIALDWRDVEGRHHPVSADTKHALLASLDLSASTTGEARARLAAIAEEREFRALPIATTLALGESQNLRLGGALADLERRFSLTVASEDGSVRQIEIRPDAGRRSAVAASDGRQALVRDIALPELPLGRHRIVADVAPECASHLAIVPSTAFLPPGLEGARMFGIATQLYSLRRDGADALGDQGIGDFTTLRLFGEAAGRAGAATLGINPIHALFPSDPSRASPYHPSDRRFLNSLTIDAFDLPAELLSNAVRAEMSRLGPQAAQLSGARIIDYAAVAGLKTRLFKAIHAAFADLAITSPEIPLVRAFENFVRMGGESLERFAIFTAIEESVGGTLRQFPEALSAPHAPGIAAFHSSHEEAIGRAKFLQFLADQQFSAAATAADRAGLKFGFYRDLAVGCAPDGAEAFAEAARLMRGVSIGAPPDPLAPKGQVWGLPPFDPRALARDGFASFGRLIAANMAHAGILRIDHVLGLKRLFLVPDGAEGSDGAYLACPFEALIGQVALESFRSRTAVVGEDLGTVPEGMREQLAKANILSYRVMRFERDEDGFLPPEQYPALAVACVSTHDLPPLAGWWEGSDLTEAARLGHIADLGVALSARAVEKAELIAAVEIADSSAEKADLDAPLSDAAAAAAHGFVAKSAAALVLVQADDLAMETIPINLPGTDRERPNWRRKILEPVEELFALPSAQTVLNEVRRWRQRSS
jgi:glycogen debranching enzyme GlgX/4-alpha-glucanotransferase